MKSPLSVLTVLITLVTIAGCSSSSQDDGRTEGAALTESESSETPKSEVRTRLEADGFKFAYKKNAWSPGYRYVLAWGDRYEHPDGRIAYVSANSNDVEILIGPVWPGTYEGHIKGHCGQATCWDDVDMTLVIESMDVSDRTADIAVAGSVQAKGRDLRTEKLTFGIPCYEAGCGYAKTGASVGRYPIFELTPDGKNIKSVIAELPSNRLVQDQHSEIIEFDRVTRRDL